MGACPLLPSSSLSLRSMSDEDDVHEAVNFGW